MAVVTCPQCGTQLDAPDNVLGAEVVCGQCNHRFVAAADAPPAAAPTGQAAPPPDQAAPTPPGEGPSLEAPPAGAEPGAAAPPPAEAPAPPPIEPAAPPPPPQAPAYIPPQAYAPPPAGPGGYGMALPPSGNATAALVLGIVSVAGGVFCCCPLLSLAGLICAVLALIFAGRGLDDVAAGRADPVSRGRAVAGRVCGIVGLALALLSLIYFIVSIAAGPGRFGRWRFNF